MPTKNAPPERNRWQRTSLIDQAVEHFCTPYYKPNNKHWEVTFRALKLTRQTIDNFWAVFYRINTSHSGQITILEFLNYFNLERTEFMEKCFDYFDCTGEHTIDFLKFVVSVFNICSLSIDTLPTFAFDIYDFNNGGELSLVEIERMVHELYGDKLISGSTGQGVLKDINHFAEQRGGALNLNSFMIYTGNHSLLLLPVFRVQRIIQNKVMGTSYWKNVERTRPDTVSPKGKSVFNPRYVQTLLRKYKEGGVTAMLNYCGDPDDRLLKLYTEKEKEEAAVINHPIDTSKIKNQRFKSAVDKIKGVNAVQKEKLRSIVTTVSSKSAKTIDLTAKAVMNAGARSRKSIVKLSSSLKRSTSFVYDNSKQSSMLKQGTNLSSHAEPPPHITPSSDKRGNLGFTSNDFFSREENSTGDSAIQTKRTPRRHKERRPRPKTAPNKSNRVSLPSQNPSKRWEIDHRISFSKRGRPRTPGVVVFSISDEGSEFERK